MVKREMCSLKITVDQYLENATNGFAAHWTALRRFLDDPTGDINFSLGERNVSRGCDWMSRLVRASFPRLSNGDADTATAMSQMMAQLRFDADIGRNIYRLQRRAKGVANKSWQHYEQLVGNVFSVEHSIRDHDIGPLATLIFQKLKVHNTDAFLAAPELDEREVDDGSGGALASSDALLKWIEQQRHAMLQMVQDGLLHSPVFLDLTYRGRGAGNDQPVMLLDKCIDVNREGIFLRAQDNDEERHASANIMVRAVRTAASLELPINMSAVMPLTDPSASGDSSVLISLNIQYEPHSLCDIELFGTRPTMNLMFNVHFPIWRHFNLERDAQSGLLEPMYVIMPNCDQISKEDQQQEQTQSIGIGSNLALSDCSSSEFCDLVHLSDYKIVPHVLWRDRNRYPFCTTVRFFQDMEPIGAHIQ
ncbi:uncharacterized protein LOC115626702 isoform X2 [Scaptodrosophila lebanonensis]|uniref:Uncharacterized protein LOC115626702 isoform X2 n=1 Tax=Drosophila lebanonensis TaxID=7225 RepID=A0A6J2TR56_DROLE|nr:uncharacterized protein LOC115626702 isoform X2 [Scaptodrosophila lebanonensis]